MHWSYASIMADNPLKLRQIHHVEFWVGNAKQAAFFYRKAFGFSEFAYSGLETGERAMTSYALKQGRARFVFATPLNPAHPAAEHLRAHGDGVRDIAFQVDDADRAFEEAVARGAEPAIEPHDVADQHGRAARAAVSTYGAPRPAWCPRSAGARPPPGAQSLRRHAALVNLARRLQRAVPARLRAARRAR